jgi:signal transduction histidine kinase/CheY-like chemotaxis protein
MVIPLAAYGVTFISRFQVWTQPLWLILNFFPILFVLLHPDLLQGWRHYRGAAAPAGFSLLPFGICASVVSALIAQVGEQVDYLRFLKPAAPGRRFGWWAALLCAGPGWVLPGMVKMLAGSVFAVLAVAAGVSVTAAGHPAIMYRVAYGFFTSPALAVISMVLLVTVAQTKINVTNAYAGSIAWSNFFARLTHRHPGRVVWLVFNVAIAVLLMELGIYRTIEPILTFYSILACAWVGAICADLVLVKFLRLGRAEIEFKRAYLFDINPVGTGGMAFAVLVGLLAKAGFADQAAHAFAPFLALLAAFMAVPLLAVATKGRFYLARKPRRAWAGHRALQCGVCGNSFEGPDVAFCPAYAAPICSLCCTLESRCRDACKPHARYTVQLTRALKSCLPAGFRRRVDPLLLRFLSVFTLSVLAIGIVLLTVYWQANSFQSSGNALAGALWRVFFCLMLIAGVFAWLQVLARESSVAAEEERSRQTRLLLEEIDAHRKTDAKLARARQVAEAANLAKTRFVVGVSHELRTPLNAVLGYAQLLELDPSIPEARREAIRIIRRSGEHLQGLIEGLMDISRIEAGRIEIERKEIRFAEFLEQIAGMFRVQAAAKGIHFRVQYPPNLPQSVVTDETRLRQILINLLSNALKFTDHGEVGFLVRLPGEVMEFEITDTGPGIPAEHLERIFEPFERVAATPVQGIGLGLTITKLLVEILGGQITVESKPGIGSRFRVQLRIPAAARAPLLAPVSRPIIGYDGRRRSILAAEDNAWHRGLLIDTLSPLGFNLLTVPDGSSCLRLAEGREVDLFLLDISMPSFGRAALDGLDVARQLRTGAHFATPIIMLSAHVPEIKKPNGAAPYDMAMAKPIDLARLLANIGRLLKLSWQYGPVTPEAEPNLSASHEAARGAIQPYLRQLRAAAQIGFVRELKETLGRVAAEAPEAAGLAASLLEMTAALQLPELCGALDQLATGAN